MDLLTLRVRVWLRCLGATTSIISVVVVGIVTGTVMGLATGVLRTSSAPDRYTSSFGGDYDFLLIQPSGAPLTREVGALEGVRESDSWTFVTAFPVGSDGQLVVEPSSFAGNDQLGGARLVEGRFTDPTSPTEFTVNRPLAELLDARPGDRFQIESYDQSQADGNEFDDSVGPAVPPFEATLVGITESPSEFENAAPNLVLSKAFLPAYPEVARIATLIAVRLDAGTDPAEFVAAVRALPGGDQVFSDEPTIVGAGPRRAVDVQISALVIVTAIAVVVSAVLIAQVARRILVPSFAERSSLNALGVNNSFLRFEIGVEAALLIACSTPVAVVTCLAVATMFPLGVLALFEPDPGIYVVPYVLALGPLIALAVAAAVGMLAATRPARERRTTRSPSSAALLAVRSGASVPFTIGSRFASEGVTSNNGGGRATFLGGVCVAGLVASIIVGVSLTDATSQPARWGATYDELFGNPFVPAHTDLVGPIANDPALEALTAATLESLPIDGVDVSIFATELVHGGIAPVLLDGRAPTSDDEIGLGREEMRKLNVGIGDSVTASADDGSTRELRVVGVSVSPDTAGESGWMTFRGLLQLRPTATRNLLLANFREGTGADAVERISELSFSPPSALPVPTSVKALERVIPAPFILGTVLAVLLIAGTAYRLELSVRSRRHDLAVLRTLGAKPGQVRRVVHWHASLCSVGALVVGLPLGIAVGRLVVARVTDAVGIVPGATVPVVTLLVLAAAVMALANIIAVVPARRATRRALWDQLSTAPNLRGTP